MDSNSCDLVAILWKACCLNIKVADIFFIKSDHDYTEIHLEKARHIATETLKHWEQTLDHNGFVRVHKSYILNLTKIAKVTSREVHMNNDETIPVGRAFKGKLNAMIGKQG